MITEFFIWMMAGTAALLLGVIPDAGDADGQIVADGVAGGIGTVMGYAGAFGNWIPWGSVAIVLFLVIAALAAGGVIKLIRIILSFMTMGGGSAA